MMPPDSARLRRVRRLRPTVTLPDSAWPVVRRARRGSDRSACRPRPARLIRLGRWRPMMRRSASGQADDGSARLRLAEPGSARLLAGLGRKSDRSASASARLIRRRCGPRFRRRSDSESTVESTGLTGVVRPGRAHGIPAGPGFRNQFVQQNFAPAAAGRSSVRSPLYPPIPPRPIGTSGAGVPRRPLSRGAGRALKGGRGRAAVAHATWGVGVGGDA
jgi:hypothetical protein